MSTVSPVEKLTNRTEPEAHHERTSTAPRRTTSVPRVLDRTTSVPRPHHKVGVASGWNLWVWLQCIGVASRCCYKEVYRYRHNNY